MTKTCPKCGEDKGLSEFHVRRSAPGGLNPRCKTCVLRTNAAWKARNLALVLAGKRAHYRANLPAYRRSQLAYNRRKKYGLDAAGLDALVLAQEGRCAICYEPFAAEQRSMHVDHCHATNAVRGLLCRSCNIGLGNFADTPSRLRAAATYLEAACPSH